ncbi:MAG: hypothetical protein RIF41_01050 [Polyangiaceae bacterium]
MTNLPSEGLGRLAILIVAAALTACGSSVILEGDGDGRGDDEGGDVTVPGGSDGSGPGAEPACAPGASLQEIAPWEGASSFIALHDGWVYWATEATVERAPRAGGGPVEVVASPAARPLGIDVDDGGVFIVVDDGTLIRVGHQGGVATILATGDGLGGAFGVVRVDDQHAYHRQSCGELARVPKHGGAVEIVAETAGCFGGFEIDEEHLYVVDQVDGSVTRVAKDGGATLLLAGGSIAKAGGYSGTTVGLALDDDAVYWVSATGGFVGAVAKVGGDVTVVIDGLTAAQDVAVDRGLLYWSEQGRVGRASVDGDGVLTLADEHGIVPMGLALDDERVFFTNYVTNGAVLSVCR